jgi:hypothetical protein
LTIAFTGYVAYRNYRKNRFAEASIQFRKKVLITLEGIYPEVFPYLYLDTNKFNNRTRQSVPIIISAATEFLYHLPFYRKPGFRRALKYYTDTAQQTDWADQSRFESYHESMPKLGDVSPTDKFKHSVDKLLSYAKEK